LPHRICYPRWQPRGGKDGEETQRGRTGASLGRAIGARHRSGAVDDKAQILDELVAVTGYHRKHSIRVLSSAIAEVAVMKARLRAVALTLDR
jgi:hypothetical protein